MSDSWKAIKLILIFVLSFSLLLSLFSPSEATLAFLFFIVILMINVHWSIKLLLTVATFDWLNYGIGFVGELCLSIAFLIYVYLWKEKNTKKNIDKESSKYLMSPEVHEIKKDTLISKLPPKEERRGVKDKNIEIKEKIEEREIIDFFDKLENRYNNKIPKDVYSDLYLSNENFNLFHSFISNTRERLDIITAFLEEDLLSELVYLLRDSSVKIRIITRNIRSEGYLAYLKKKFNLSIELKKMNKNHSKLMIRDSEKIITGSSNITEASMSKNEYNYDANVLTDNKDDVSLAQKIFNSLWNNENLIINEDENNSLLLYSKDSKKQLPKILESLIKDEKEEIILVFSSSLIDKRIIKKIREYNMFPKIRIVTSNKWSDEPINEYQLDTMKYLMSLSKRTEDKIQVLPKNKLIHAKIYIFKSQNITLISSQNLTVKSWQSLFETGYLIKDKRTVKKIIEGVNKLPDSVFDSINVCETERPMSTWSESTSEITLKVPWNLSESDPNWKIEDKIYGKFYRVVKPLHEKNSVVKTEIEYEKMQIYERPLEEQEKRYSFLEAASRSKDPTLKDAINRLEKAKKTGDFKRVRIIEEYIEKYIELKKGKRKKRFKSRINTSNDEALKRLREAGLDPSKLK